MNKNLYAYLYWCVLVFLVYSVAGLLTEHEFLPNPVWLVTGKPAPGFCSGCQTGLVLIILVVVLIPIALWLRSKAIKELAIISKRNVVTIAGIILVISLPVGLFLWQRETTEERQSQAQYEMIVQNNNLVRNAFSSQKSPLAPFFLNMVVENRTATIYLMEGAGQYVDTSTERRVYLDPIGKAVLQISDVDFVQWRVGGRLVIE